MQWPNARSNTIMAVQMDVGAVLVLPSDDVKPQSDGMVLPG